MKKRFALIALLPLAGCGGQTTSGINAGDATACAAALFSAGIAGPAALLTVATAVPACIPLASEVLQAIIADVSKKQHARGIRQ